MTWDITAEFVSAIIIAVILVYSKKGFSLSTLRNIVFQGCLRVTFLSVLTNILSTLLLGHIHDVPLALNYGILIVYFISTPLMGTIYFLYTLTTVYENERKKLFKYAKLGLIPAFIYIVLVILNPFTDMFFTLDLVNGYQKGVLIVITYFIFYLYVILSVFVVVPNRSKIDRHISKILEIFPIISGIVVMLQLIYPTVILTGTAATCALLIIYLYLQNRQMFEDPLTNLLNRQEFSKMISLNIEKNKSFTIVMLSLKEFKYINDKLGLLAGDRLLISLCDYLRTLAPNDALYRYSGDEFVIFLKDSSNTKEIIQTITKRMEEPWGEEGYKHYLNYCMSSIDYPSVVDTKEQIVKGLEYTISKVKMRKDTHYLQCSKDILMEIERNYEIVQILKEAIQNDSFEVVYQPILNTKKNVFNKAEALVRLPENHLGYVSPVEFIPIAEETGMIIPLTYCVLKKTCQFISRLLDANLDIDGISFNLSVVCFTQNDLEDRLMEIIDSYHIPYKMIKVEITESILISNFEVVSQFIARMQAKGFRFMLDDFGTGYSNFTRVLSIPFQVIKLDRSLIQNAIRSERSSILVLSLIQSFKQLHYDILAEGVENEEERNLVILNGCDYIQGFYYTKPLVAEQAFTFIKEGSNLISAST